MQPFRRVLRDRRGVTLPELLTVISIIATLASTATVSYGSVRQYARDLRRVGDMGTLQAALELHFQNHFSYPPDTAPGGDGIVLGLPGSESLADNGFTSAPVGTLYLRSVAPNPRPGGLAYVYRSYNPDGTDCDAPPCARYTVTFLLEGRVGDLAAGPHVVGSEGIDIAPSGGGQVGPLPTVDTSLAAVAAGGLGRAAFIFREVAVDVAESPAVEQAASAVVAPAVTVVAALNAASAVPVAQLPQIMLFFFSQPVLYVFRPRRHGWGTVYNAYTRLPVDLAIVRLRKASDGAIVRSMVTDAHGRFHFVVPRGIYRIEVTKPGFRFPTQALRDRREDAGYLDLYHGEALRVDEDDASLTPNVPLDPVAGERSDAQIRRSAAFAKLKHGVALSGLVLAAASFVAVPSLMLGGVVLLHVGLYAFFRRVSIPRRPRSWGVVYEEGTARRAVPSAVVRMYALPYHKMVDSAVADARGRYRFLVGPSQVYLTVTKDGFRKTETEPLDLSAVTEPTVIANDLPLRKEKRQ